jgi:hypothetical protein
MKKTLTITISMILVVAFACAPKAHGRALPPAETAPHVHARDDSTDPAGEDDNGPTVLLNYGNDALAMNPIRSFMHFVPLISPVPVGREVCPANRQQVGIISYEKKVTPKSFSVTCEFEMMGSGFCRYTFDPAGMVALRMVECKKTKGEPLTNLLDYIHFEGEGFGRIHIKGTVEEAELTVTEVELEFNGRGHKSPATIGLYELKAKEGQYRYENRSHPIVARVNSLAFRRSESPRMEITLASISKKAGGNGPLGQLKAVIANLFIKPVRIDPLGNETLLGFGLALCKQEPTFTFPKADNMKEIPVLAAAPKIKIEDDLLGK